MKLNNSKKGKGFTLIELMIVIAIIGILAALALPAYSDYVGRSQATEGLISTGGLRNEISIYYWEHKAYPPAGSQVMTVAQELEGKYYSAKGVVVTPDTGEINVNFDSGTNQGKTLVLTPVSNNTTGQTITWRCSGTIGTNRIPSTCQ